jgi:hypothetical protein
MEEMAFVLEAGFDVEICDDGTCARDIYRLDDLPRDLRELVVNQRSFDELEWYSPDGCRWRLRAVLG